MTMWQALAMMAGLFLAAIGMIAGLTLIGLGAGDPAGGREEQPEEEPEGEPEEPEETTSLPRQILFEGLLLEIHPSL